MSENADIRIDYFHSTFPGWVENIFRKGFRKKGHIDERGYESNKSYMGCIGWGVYISPRMSVSLLFGRALIRVNLKKGTRILDITLEPDEKELRSLKRKYGRALFSSDAPIRKILPRNKQLTLKELIALTRYHYSRTWGEVGGRMEHKNYHYGSLYRCMSMLRMYKYDGMGNPADDVGIVIFSPERVIAKELVMVAAGPLDKYFSDPENNQFESIEEAKELFQKYGSAEHKELVERCNRWLLELSNQQPKDTASIIGTEARNHI